MNKSTLCVGLAVLAISCGNPSQNAPEFVDSVAEALANDGKISLERLQWTREPAAFEINGDTIGKSYIAKEIARKAFKKNRVTKKV